MLFIYFFFLESVELCFIRHSGNYVGDFLAQNASANAGVVWVEEVLPKAPICEH